MNGLRKLLDILRRYNLKENQGIERNDYFCIRMRDKDVQLSIIVPVYNVEAYLPACVASILNDPPEDFELILVDDCSPDHSGALCDEYARKNPQIRVIHHPVNKGLSEARNSGLAVARGLFVTFIDSDDTIAPGTLSENMALLGEHPEVDLLEYPIYVHYKSPGAFVHYPGKDSFGEEDRSVFRQWLKEQGYRHAYACNKIFRCSLWENIRFMPGVCFEDVYTIPLVIEKVRRRLTSSKGMYFYYQRENTITTAGSFKAQRDLLEAFICLFVRLQKDESLLSQPELAELYLFITDRQIDLLLMGGPYRMPVFRYSLTTLWRMKLPASLRLKGFLLALLGRSYYSLYVTLKKKLSL